MFASPWTKTTRQLLRSPATQCAFRVSIRMLPSTHSARRHSGLWWVDQLYAQHRPRLAHLAPASPWRIPRPWLLEDLWIPGRRHRLRLGILCRMREPWFRMLFRALLLLAHGPELPAHTSQPIPLRTMSQFTP